MSDFTWVRLLLGLLIGLGSVLLLMIHKLFAARAANPRDRFAPFSVVFLNYLFVWILFLLWMLFYEPDIALVVFRVSFHLLPSVIAHSLLLLALTPLLRRRVSAVTCAELWTLPFLLALPVMYFTDRETSLENYFLFEPWLVLQIPRLALWIIVAVWAAGFLGVLGWKLLSHVRFRRTLLRGAYKASEATRSEFLTVWWELCQTGTGFGWKLRIYRSPAADSPITVGLFRRTSCLVLPEREYTDEELRMIFRHELIHLLHRDSAAKFGLVFLCALGWFIPSLWLGLGRAAEDMELCCDEFATKTMREDERKTYASLLLSAAGTAKGFTTCLSASASGLRYRLSRVLHPEKRRVGYLITALLSVLFVFFYGAVGFVVV